MSPAGKKSELVCLFVKINAWRDDRLTWKDGEDAWNWWHIDPFMIVLINSSRTFLPVLNGLPLNRRADK